jgi:hypothetical protein
MMAEALFCLVSRKHLLQRVDTMADRLLIVKVCFVLDGLTYCFQPLSVSQPRALRCQTASFIEVIDDMDKEVHNHQGTEAVKHGKAFRRYDLDII